jgi:hypothetical protein
MLMLMLVVKISATPCSNWSSGAPTDDFLDVSYDEVLPGRGITPNGH